MADVNKEENEQNKENEENEEKGNEKLEALQKQIDEMKEQHQKQLDQYRNEKGQLKKQIDELEKEKMSEEERLEQEKKDLEKEKQELKRDRLEAHKEKTVAKKELDSRLAKYINVNHDMKQEDIERQVEDLKSIQTAMEDEILDELKNKGKIIDTHSTGSNDEEEGGIGKKLAEKNSENSKEVQKGQEHYFGENG